MNFDVKKCVSIRAQHILNITLTATIIDLAESLQNMFNKNNNSNFDDNDQEQTILSVINQTGYDISIYDFIGIEVFTLIRILIFKIFILLSFRIKTNKQKRNYYLKIMKHFI
jgi:helix-turn-helix protein